MFGNKSKEVLSAEKQAMMYSEYISSIMETFYKTLIAELDSSNELKKVHHAISTEGIDVLHTLSTDVDSNAKERAILNTEALFLKESDKNKVLHICCKIIGLCCANEDELTVLVGQLAFPACMITGTYDKSYSKRCQEAFMGHTTFIIYRGLQMISNTKSAEEAIKRRDANKKDKDK